MTERRNHGAKRRLFRRNERGISLVESALVLPLVMLLIFGILEGALLFRTYLSATNAANNGARIGSIQGQDVYADFDILNAIKHGATGASLSQIQSMIIYKATAPGAGPSAECINQAMAGGGIGIVGSCNVYVEADLNRPKTDFGPSGFGADQYWAAKTRNLSLSVGTDYMGVWVYMQCQCMSASFFGIVPQLHATTVIQMEAALR